MSSASLQPSLEVLLAVLTAKPEKVGELQQALEGLTQEIRKQSGCLEARLSREVPGESRFLLYLAWKDSAALFAHLASEEFRILQGALSLLSSSAEFESLSSKSAEVLEAVRKVEGIKVVGRGPFAEFQS